jgi:hypothetical protein
VWVSLVYSFVCREKSGYFLPVEHCGVGREVTGWITLAVENHEKMNGREFFSRIGKCVNYSPL